MQLCSFYSHSTYRFLYYTKHIQSIHAGETRANDTQKREKRKKSIGGALRTYYCVSLPPTHHKNVGATVFLIRLSNSLEFYGAGLVDGIAAKLVYQAPTEYFSYSYNTWRRRWPQKWNERRKKRRRYFCGALPKKCLELRKLTDDQVG